MKHLVKFLYPGIRLKRWIFLFILSSLVFLSGLSGVMGKAFKGIRINLINVEKYINPIRDMITNSTKLVTIDIIAILLGGIVFILGIRFFFKAISALYPSKIDVVKASYDELQLLKGPRIVTVGGGTGLSTLLKGLKVYSSNLTAVVTVADDGGSSGKLRKQLKMLPPGDIRSCMVALADSSGLLGKVFQYRFNSNNKNLDGHSFGNLFIAALTNISGSFEKGVQEASKILAIRGKVLPVTLEKVVLEAKLKNKKIIKGQSNISHCAYAIDKVFLVPSDPLPSNTALSDIKKAKLIILGPGSLYTSIIPNLLIKEVSDAIYHSKAKVVYICNIMTQPGETKGYRLSDHVNAINNHVGYRDLINYVIVNNHYNIPEKVLVKYAKKNSYPVEIDSNNMKTYSVKIISDDLVQIADGLVRHDPEKLAKIILRLTL
ncbi:MAG: hypothetical protein A2452_05430 [Candidatus Firestonebacteria bacterium RIFOXYC2_FULL_39_67]|nr:MAG: hypothetical protein A2536_10260 [Candidatus Firestonebacteria bacterium RIFOXYD2_FULL_39_29]OGF55270.1 MAG: hypothetical protein A2497_00410 [Candidatus Firestonebacteria bacterium RifOxyC12_full_39_7]OGF56381.1 MAG: hypothetical protein A2452_05430 [Candidatus Firestonebacteria bacterium RIFOXYC2_FULL_39_67]